MKVASSGAPCSFLSSGSQLPQLCVIQAYATIGAGLHESCESVLLDPSTNIMASQVTQVLSYRFSQV